MVRESPEAPRPGFCWLWASGTVELLVGIASGLFGSAALGLAYSRPVWPRLASSIGAILGTATLAEKLLGGDPGIHHLATGREIVRPVQSMDLGFGGALGLAGLAAALLALCWIGTRSLTARVPRWAPLATVIALAVASAALYRAALTERRLRTDEWLRNRSLRLEDMQSPLPEVVLVFGIVMAVLAGLMLDRVLRANRRAREAEAAHRLLERAMQDRKQEILEIQRSQKMLRLYAAELQRKNEEFDAALRTAREALEHKGRFIANTSHEIRTPMNGIIGMTELLLASPLDPEQRELAQTVKESADSLLRILNDILDFSKVEAGRMQFDSVPFDPGETLASVVSLWTPRAVASGLKLSQQVDSQLPQRVLGDPVRVRQVLTNLIGNALKFTEQGTVCVQADACHTSQGEVRLRFEVNDTGIGIAKDKLRHIFESFTQVDESSTRRHGGTGLGLAICKQLVEAMGGDIGVDSAIGAGTRFWFEIPFRVPEEQADRKAVSPDLECAVVFTPAPRVLLVEDNLINRQVAFRMLEKEGCVVDAVDNGELAVAAVAAQHYDAVFMDVQMPIMDGLQATQLIREQEGTLRHTPIVAMTAGAMEGDRDRCLQSGMDDYLAKPINQEGVHLMVARWAKVAAAQPPEGQDSLSAV